MGKKRKASGRDAATEAPEGWNDRGGRLGPINTYADVADSEDEFHINRDKIMLDEGPDAKRRRKYQQADALLEASDEEILGYSSDEDEDSIASSEVEQSEEDEDEDLLGNEKYGGDAILTEKDAEDDEKERRRLQRKQLKKLTKEDFGFEDEDEWLDTANKEDGEEKDTITEVLQDIEITPDMTPDAKLEILKSRYPEFEHLADEFVALHPVFENLQQQLEAESATSNGIPQTKTTTTVKCRALAAYIASLAMYFALFCSPTDHSDSPTKPMDPDDLHDHPVMETIVKCREVWDRVKSLKAPEPIEATPPQEPSPEPISPESLVTSRADVSKKSKRQKALDIIARDAASERASKLEAANAELADLSSLMPKSRKLSKKSQPVIFRDDYDSDFGEETHLSAKAAAEKAQKKKSLRFHTSQIAQKSNRRAAAGRDAGGDTDLPHKERLRDRQARLNAEAEKRGKKMEEYGRGGADLDPVGNSDAEEDIVSDSLNQPNQQDSDDGYYDMVVQASKKKKADKAAKYEAVRQAKEENAIVRVVEGEVGEDGKRAIGYVIEKNKGLTPKRKKDVRNPRVKKRKKYEEKKKKLGSTKAVYKGGEERGGYGGEKTGIKTGLIRSIKL